MTVPEGGEPVGTGHPGMSEGIPHCGRLDHLADVDPSLKALVQQGEGEGDALWAGLGPGSTGGQDPQGGVLRDTQGPSPPLQTAATPLRKAIKLCHTWGLPGQGLHTRLHPQAWGASPRTEDIGCHL